MISKGTALLACLTLAACNEANHLGNPLTLPVRALGNAASNAVYDARRARVADVLQRRGDALREELRAPAPQPTSGSALAELIATARIAPARYPILISDLRDLSQAPPPDWVEQATVIAMVHGP